jgi:hypothetical protein
MFGNTAVRSSGLAMLNMTVTSLTLLQQLAALQVDVN